MWGNVYPISRQVDMLTRRILIKFYIKLNRDLPIWRLRDELFEVERPKFGIQNQWRWSDYDLKFALNDSRLMSDKDNVSHKICILMKTFFFWISLNSSSKSFYQYKRFAHD